jgi:hypothetical protein
LWTNDRPVDQATLVEGFEEADDDEDDSLDLAGFASPDFDDDSDFESDLAAEESDFDPLEDSDFDDDSDFESDFESDLESDFALVELDRAASRESLR